MTDISSMHDVVNVDPDVHPPFARVKVLHNVRLLPGAVYARSMAGPSNAVMAEITLADGTQLDIWPDGYMQVTGKGEHTSQLHRVVADAAGPQVMYERTLTSAEGS